MHGKKDDYKADALTNCATPTYAISVLIHTTLNSIQLFTLSSVEQTNEERGQLQSEFDCSERFLLRGVKCV